MEDYITQIGIGGIFAVIVIGRVLDFLKSRNGKNGPLPLVKVGEIPQECHDTLQELYRMCGELQKVASETQEHARNIFEMHNVRDGDGQPVWDTGRLAAAVERQGEAMTRLSENIKEQTVATKQLLVAVQKLNGGN
jgi:hypothetical protein